MVLPWSAIALVTAGVMLIARRTGGSGQRLTFPWFALAASLSWGTSPLFIRWGLDGLSSPVIGVTIGLAAATALYAVGLATGRAPTTSGTPPEVRRWILIGGILVAAAIAAQWTALDLVEVNVVVTLQQVATPVVVLVAPFIVGTAIERWTWRLILGMIAVIATRINSMGVNIEKISTEDKDYQFTFVDLEMMVQNRVHLARIIKRLRAINYVRKVARIKN